MVAHRRPLLHADARTLHKPWKARRVRPAPFRGSPPSESLRWSAHSDCWLWTELPQRQLPPQRSYAMRRRSFPVRDGAAGTVHFRSQHPQDHQGNRRLRKHQRRKTIAGHKADLRAGLCDGAHRIGPVTNERRQAEQRARSLLEPLRLEAGRESPEPSWHRRRGGCRGRSGSSPWWKSWVSARQSTGMACLRSTESRSGSAKNAVGSSFMEAIVGSLERMDGDARSH